MGPPKEAAVKCMSAVSSVFCRLEPVEMWGSHIDPTINLHDRIYAVDGDDVVEVWPIAARGYPEQREG